MTDLATQLENAAARAYPGPYEKQRSSKNEKVRIASGPCGDGRRHTVCTFPRNQYAHANAALLIVILNNLPRIIAALERDQKT